MECVDILLLPGFPALPLTLVTEPLRVARREAEGQGYSWRLVSVEGGAVRASSGFRFETEPLPARPSRLVVVLASYDPELAAAPKGLAWLRRAARHGSTLACVDTGAHILAQAGLARSAPLTMHPEARAAFATRYPDCAVHPGPVHVAGARASAVGGVATLDMMLAVLARDAGAALAARVAEVLSYRPADTPEPPVPEALEEALALMEAHLDVPLTIDEVAARTGLAPWTLARRTKRYFGLTPAALYRKLRLDRARNMLRNSVLPVADIATACGYESPEALARAYRTYYGLPPSQDRRLPGA